MLATYGDDAYKIVLVLHILCAIIGFGAVFLNALYGQQAKSRKGAEGLAISEANELVTKVGEFFIIAVFFLGLALVLMSDDVIGFGQTWVWLAMTLFVVAFAVSTGLMATRSAHDRPAARAGRGGPPPARRVRDRRRRSLEMEKIGKQMAVIGPFLNIMLIVILALMVFKPGF